MSYSRYGCGCWQCAADAKALDDPHAAGDDSLSAAPAQYQHAYPYTGDYRIDALIQGVEGQSGLGALDYRWNAPAALGSAVTVTYSFMSVKPFYGGTDSDGDTGFSEFTSQQKAAVRQIMSRLDLELGITLTEVNDSTFSYGEIRFGNNHQSTSAGYTWLPNSAGDDKSGDVWIDLDSSGSTNPQVGSYAWSTLVHEIGHALGLKHPGNYNAGDPSNDEPGNYLGLPEDNYNYTLMSYNDVAGGQQRAWFGMYDLLALKKLYGTGDWGAGDTVYNSYRDSTGNVLEIIDDASGYDTLDLSGVTLGATVDMRPGGFSSVGRDGSVAAVNNLSIELTTTIEKFIGTGTNDSVIGNDAANTFVLGQGTNSAQGGAGIDIVAYALNHAAYQIGPNGGGWHITSATGVDDTLASVERALFADHKLALDISGNAGTAAKILGAVYGASAVTAHPDYVRIGLTLLDAGTSYASLVQTALDVRLGPHSNGDVVTLLYTNVAGVAPSQDIHATYLGQLESGTQTQATLGMFAADHELNLAHIDLVGLAQTGLVYA
jgi:hypothetical protein